MVPKKSVQRVLRMVWAGKEAPGAPQGPATGSAPGQAPTSEPIEKSYVLYTYFAPEDKAIDFKNISTDLKNAAKSTALVEKLESKSGDGVTAYSAGYFSWRKVIVVTNKYDQAKKNYIVYSADVDSMGKITPGKESITPNTKYPTPDQVKEEFNIFKDGVINIQTDSPGSYETYYFNNPQDDIVRRLLANPELANKGERYNDFVKKMDQYRIWTGTGLIRPDMRRSNNDGVPGGYYPGGQESFEKMILPQAEGQSSSTQPKQAPQQPSLGEKEEQKSIYEPVTKKTEPVEGDYLDTPTQGVKMAAQDTKAVRRVMMAYLKDAAYSTVTPGTTNTEMSTPANKKRQSIPVSDVPQENMMGAKALQDLAKDQTKMQTQIQNLQKNIGQRAQQLSRLC